MNDPIAVGGRQQGKTAAIARTLREGVVVLEQAGAHPPGGRITVVVASAQAEAVREAVRVAGIRATVVVSDAIPEDEARVLGDQVALREFARAAAPLEPYWRQFSSKPRRHRG